MKFRPKARDELDSLGIYVDFQFGEDATFRYAIRELRPYRFTLLITLPPGMEDKWLPNIFKIIADVELSNSWPLWFDYENVRKHISFAELERLNQILSHIPFYVYGSPDEAPSFNEDVYRKWHNAARRALAPKKRSVATDDLVPL